ncbi:hypothetical protein GcM1_238132 [Golovinomyces cichoracearum]|uniref:Secreted effector protein n=1 Tax=Golovinomyces cichoracearum TaxID=62708 RepID=A0A420IJN3_9PEZI|nr:hypothetical protein GcM1_238132 [Golovinomyces cichoracearum]
MRHSATHLVVAFCTGMAVSAAPLSPLPPVSPALLSPLPVNVPHSIIPRAESHEFENAYHVSDSEGIEERDINSDDLNDSGIEQSNVEFESAGNFDLDVDGGDDSDGERRSAPAIFNRSPTPYPRNIKDEDQDLNNPENDDDYASIASFPDFSDDEDDLSSTASDGIFSVASDKGDSEPENQPLDVPNKEKAEKRSVEIDGQSERHGGRTYITKSEWKV